jgi:hypothetical protein
MGNRLCQFYVSMDEDVLRCRQSHVGHRPITITGTTEDGESETFTGIVEAVDYIRTNPPSMSWRVRMISE